MSAIAQQTTVVLNGGDTTAYVTVTGGVAGEQTFTLPVSKLLELLAQCVVDQSGAPDEPERASRQLITKVNTLTNWRVNLFPDVPVAMIEAGSSMLCVRGFEERTRTLLWKRDGSATKAKELVFRVPKMLVVALWQARRLRESKIFTVEAPGWPSLLTAEDRILRPWAAGNVFEDGRVCWGSARLPEFTGDGASSLLTAFFGSVFNDHTARLTVAPGFEDAWYAERGSPPMTPRGYSLGALHTWTMDEDGTTTGRVPHDPTRRVSLWSVITSLAGL